VQVGNFNIQQATSTATENSLKRTTIATSSGATATATLTISNGNNSISVYPNLPAGSFNPIVQSNDRGIITAGNPILLSTQGTNYTGIRISPSSTVIGQGGTTSSATNAVICDASGVTIRPSIRFPDNKVQNSAFTGGTAGTYTNTNMTIDANGRISAISNGTIPVIPFAPRFTNYADYQSTNTGYSQGTTFVCNGSWGKRDYIILRITAQGNWIEDGAGWRYYATTSGQLIFRPHYAPSGTWANLSPGPGTSVIYPYNSGNANIGPIKKAVYYTGNSNFGNQEYFVLGGVNKSIQFGFHAPGQQDGFSGWAYSHLIEYIVHSTSGGTVTIEPGTEIGTDATNNELP
jgi:hypothetical protein